MSSSFFEVWQLAAASGIYTAKKDTGKKRIGNEPKTKDHIPEVIKGRKEKRENSETAKINSSKSGDDVVVSILFL